MSNYTRDQPWPSSGVVMMPTQADIDRLNKKIHELEARLAELQPKEHWSVTVSVPAEIDVAKVVEASLGWKVTSVRRL